MENWTTLVKLLGDESIYDFNVILNTGKNDRTAVLCHIISFNSVVFI